MRFSKYEVLLKVFEYGNITKASEELNYTQSGVSQIISAFENEFGFRIFIRNKSGITPTENGLRIKAPLEHIVKWENILKKLGDSIVGLKNGEIKIGVFSSVAMQWIPGIIKEFSALHPDISYELVYGNYEEINELIHQDKIDCGFTVEYPELHAAFIPLIQDEFYVVLPPNHKLSKMTSIPINCLDGEDLIMPAEGDKFDVGKIIKDTGIKPNIRFRSGDDYSAVAMVEKDLGFCILPHLILEGIESKAISRPLSEHFYRSLGLSVHSMQYITPLTSAFIDFVVDWIRNRYS
ncbi:MAG: LysR family transcriptional regulator [Lachnospiraceae bacterium]|jgi:DNA-binding transcriptional LysR family regulator|nr:LysR family transcriptional regulator [Lachnospiraceae bacterium]